MKQVLESPNKDKLMAEFFPKNDGKEYQDISQDAKDSVQKNKATSKAHEMLMITDTVTVQVVLPSRNS